MTGIIGTRAPIRTVFLTGTFFDIGIIVSIAVWEAQIIVMWAADYALQVNLLVHVFAGDEIGIGFGISARTKRSYTVFRIGVKNSK